VRAGLGRAAGVALWPSGGAGATRTAPRSR
jgi:hypothetical protein